MALGNIKIQFGTVVDINDEDKIYRCRVLIPGFTDNIEVDSLPWYFPWYGVNFLPQLNDEVPVIVFDDNYLTCFYGRKIKLEDAGIDSGDYENYLEIFRREIAGKNVKLTYTESEGILFLNDEAKVQIQKDMIDFVCGNTLIQITKQKVHLGGTGGEAMLLGDKTVDELNTILTHQQNMITQIFSIFTAIAAAATPIPFTLPIATVITPLVAALQPTLIAENTAAKAKTNLLQSTTVFNK